MSRLNPAKLHVCFLSGAGKSGPRLPCHYTLTHSDKTGDLYLAIGPDYDRKAISGWYTRLMRDEVLAEWKVSNMGPALQLYCHISGGLSLSPAAWRYQIFQRELPLVLEAFRLGDNEIYVAHPELDKAPIWVTYRAWQRRHKRSELWGTPADFRQVS